LRTLAIALFGFTAVTMPALAQAPTAAPPPQPATKQSWNGLPDRFQIDAGYFRVEMATGLRLEGTVGPANEVSFEKDLGVSDTADTYWLDATIRMSRRNSFKISYISVTREGQPQSLTRDFTWDDKTYSAGLTASGTIGMDVISSYFRFAITKRDRFEAGIATGLGYLQLRAGIKAQGSLTGPGGEVEKVNLDDSGKLGVPTGDIGGYFTAWLTKRVVMRGDFLYFLIRPQDAEASVTDWRVGVDYYPLRNVGVGVQYKYNEFRYQQGIEQGNLGGTVSFQGLQVYGSFLF
jgi:opacity protein-like surface antigen